VTDLRFALLNAAHDDTHTTRNFRRELDATLVEFDTTDGHLPPSVDPATAGEAGAGEFDAAVVTGSASSVYHDAPWITSAVEWVADAADAGLPVLGVCFGHQLLATALGGRVASMDGYEIGYNEVHHDGDGLFDGIDRTFSVFTTHGDAVVELPPGATRLAENAHGVQAFRQGQCWGVQFHPGYDTETAEHVTDGKRDRLGDDRVDTVLAGVTPDSYESACEAKQLFDNFCRAVRSSESVAAD
jgi:GMP synthase - Glutamine amidotransferase domain